MGPSVESRQAEMTPVSQNYSDQPKRKISIPSGVWVAVIIVLAVLVWWYKTNTWPVVAMVGMKPITRFEVDKMLYKQNGTTVIEGLITQRVIEEELDKEKVNVTKSEIDARIEELRKSMPAGKKLEDEVVAKGMTMEEVSKLIELDLRLAKAVGNNITVTKEEVDKYVKDNGQYLTGKTDTEKQTEAQNLIKADKQQTAMDSWVTAAKGKVKVWRLVPAPSSAPVAVGSGQ